MHELSLVQSILAAALKATQSHNAERIKSIRLVVSDRSSISPASLDFHFEMVSKGTLAEGARLEIDVREDPITCLRCGTEWLLADGDYVCPSCGEIAPNLPSTDEIRLSSVEIE